MIDEKSISSMTFEESMSLLSEISEKLESGQMKLDEIVESYKIATKLKNHCQKKLRNATDVINKLSHSEE
jgi:exodeoxyribonuclease VII small subunit